jgi:hypothetical protein
MFAHPLFPTKELYYILGLKDNESCFTEDLCLMAHVNVNMLLLCKFDTTKSSR